MNETNLVDMVGLVRDVVLIISLMLVLVLVYKTSRKINQTVDKLNAICGKIESAADSLHLPGKGSIGFVYKIIKTITSFGRSKKQ